MLLFFVNNSRNNTTQEYQNRTLYACRLFPEFFNIVAVAGAQPKIFQGRGGFMELGHFDKHFDTRKRVLQGKKIGLSSPRYS